MSTIVYLDTYLSIKDSRHKIYHFIRINLGTNPSSDPSINIISRIGKAQIRD